MIVCLIQLLMAAGWSSIRQADEQENVKISRNRVDTVAAELSKLPLEARSLDALIQKGMLKPEALKDAWGRELQFDPADKVVYSLGSDGLTGGSGFAADLKAAVK